VLSDGEDDDGDEVEDSSQVMIRKEDPDFKPIMETAAPLPDKTNLRRSGR